MAVLQNGAVARLASDTPALDYALVASPASYDDVATVGLLSEQDEGLSLQSEERDEFRFDLFHDSDLEDRPRATEADLFTAETRRSTQGAVSSSGSSELTSELISEAEPEPDRDYDDAVNAHLPDQPSSFTGSDLESSGGVSPVSDQCDATPSSVGQGVADPWETPLPAYEYSRSEWPVLAGPNLQRSPTRRRVAIAAIVVLAAAAAFYFIIYRTSPAELRAAANAGAIQPVSAIAERDASTARPEDSDAGNRALPTSADKSVNAVAKPGETAANEAAASNEGASAQGRFSLQAAAFPTQSGAGEFAEKLRRAGLPSYVAPVDLSRRGRWFRVRIGRFNAAEEAQKFAGEAQQRARGAGFSLQLIVCQYDQP